MSITLHGIKPAKIQQNAASCIDEVLVRGMERTVPVELRDRRRALADALV